MASTVLIGYIDAIILTDKKNITFWVQSLRKGKKAKEYIVREREMVGRG